VCDLETSRMGAPYIYDISRLRVNLYSASCWLFTQKCHGIYDLSQRYVCVGDEMTSDFN